MRAAAGPFRTAPFQAALDAGAPVRPVGVTLRRGGRAAPEAAVVGGLELAVSVRRVLGVSGLVCELTVLPVIPSGPGRPGPTGGGRGHRGDRCRAPERVARRGPASRGRLSVRC